MKEAWPIWPVDEGDAMGSGDIGSMAGACGSGRDETGSSSRGAGGIEGGEVNYGIRGRGGEDGAADGGIAGQDRRERMSSPSSSRSRNSSISLRCLLVLFSANVMSPGGEGGASSIGVHGLGDSGVGVSGEAFLPAEGVMAGEMKCARCLPTAVAA